MKQNRLILFIFCAGLLGCNYTKVKQSAEDKSMTFAMPQEKIAELSYGLVNQKVFLAKCTSCHGTSGNINLETYPEVLKNIDLIKKVVFQERSMPKRGSLTNEELAYLWNWLKLGAPEQAQNGTAPPPVVEEPILPTFDSINTHVFQTSCKECHNPTGKGKRIMLDKDSLMNSPLELILPGNPDESGLVVTIERVDDKRMPPGKEGYSELSPAVKAAVRRWIQNGAKD